tara:strand:+ start:719 stop:1096 length:378 start_codon:yes stop_codon:yes gene_type:complete
MRFLQTETFRFAATLTLVMTICAATVMLPAVWAKKKSSGLNNKVESAKIYVRGYEDGREGTIAAINANGCGIAYRQRGIEPGPECYEFIENFKLYETRYEAAKKVVEESKNNGKSKKRNRKNTNR